MVRRLRDAHFTNATRLAVRCLWRRASTVGASGNWVHSQNISRFLEGAALFSPAELKSSLHLFFRDFISNEFQINKVLWGGRPKIAIFRLISEEGTSPDHEKGYMALWGTPLERSDSLPPRFVHWRVRVAFLELLAFVFGPTRKF